MIDSTNAESMADGKSSPTIKQLRGGSREHELASTVALVRSEVVKTSVLGGLIDEVGSAVRLVQLSEDDRLFSMPDSSHAVIGGVTDTDISRAYNDVLEWLKRGLDVRSVLDRTYPSELHEIFNRPPLLFVKGIFPPLGAIRFIAVVGTRKPTDDGLRRATRLAAELVDAGFGILSGLATGIDTVAHTAALEARGATSAVMGTGLDRLYPPENALLADRIVDSGGALLSQFFPRQHPTTWTFPLRNVVMSGLSLATVVVEAGETSGARMQARVALQHGRTVFLLQSLVAQHEWAQKYVTEGAYGTRAFAFSSTDDIVSCFSGSEANVERLAVA
jgi:DNA processing protein